MKNRNLDGVYFRVRREGKWQSICFTDLTFEERDDVLRGKRKAWLESMVCHLADRLRIIGDELDIVVDDIE